MTLCSRIRCNLGHEVNSIYWDPKLDRIARLFYSVGFEFFDTQTDKPFESYGEQKT